MRLLIAILLISFLVRASFAGMMDRVSQNETPSEVAYTHPTQNR